MKEKKFYWNESNRMYDGIDVQKFLTRFKRCKSLFLCFIQVFYWLRLIGKGSNNVSYSGRDLPRYDYSGRGLFDTTSSENQWGKNYIYICIMDGAFYDKICLTF